MAVARTAAEIPPHYLNLWRVTGAPGDHPRAQQLCRVVCLDGSDVLVRFVGQADIFGEEMERLDPHMLLPELPPDRQKRRRAKKSSYRRASSTPATTKRQEARDS